MATINATTKLEAINAMLASIGESPVASIDTSNVDVEMAQNTLHGVVREICSQRWRFNTEYGLVLSPTAAQGAGNIYEVPEDLLSFDLSSTTEQAGMDIIIRPSKTYAPIGTLVFYDRRNATEEISQATLKINPVWLFDFEKCPQALRTLATVRAARKYQGEVKGSEVLEAISADDEQMALQAAVLDQRVAAPRTTSGKARNETEAVNFLLSLTKSEPVVSVDALDSPEAVEADNTLRDCVREICAEGWQFNTEHGYELLPDGNYDYTDPNGVVTNLKVFEVPSDLLSFEVTASPGQQGMNYLDMAMRPSRTYTPLGTRIFADRTHNHDGHNRDEIFIDPVWLFSFDDLPEEAKHYALVLAARRYAPEASRYQLRDEVLARRAVKRAHGHTDSRTIFDNASVRRVLGGRLPGPAGAWDYRGNKR